MFCRTCGGVLPVGAHACPYCSAPVPAVPLIWPGARTYTVAGLGTAVVVGLTATVVLAAASTVGEVVALTLMAPGDAAVAVAVLSALPYLLAFLTTIVLVIVWTFRAARNALAFPGADVPGGAGWAIAGWLVPVASLFMPYRTVAGIARTTFDRADTPAVVKWWWAAWLLFLFGERGASSAAEAGGSTAYQLGYGSVAVLAARRGGRRARRHRPTGERRAGGPDRGRPAARPRHAGHDDAAGGVIARAGRVGPSGHD